MRYIQVVIGILLAFLLRPAFAQEQPKRTGTIKGKVVDETTREPVPYANIIVEGTVTGTTSGEDGSFTITQVAPGYVKLVVSYVGYKTRVTEDLFVTPDKIPYVEIGMTTSGTELQAVEISGQQFTKKDESPVSVQTIGIREIERNPGGNRDISKVIQSLPGVASSPSFRNDIIIRGGAPSENRFYLDGVEIPIINHFQTQGATGGPVGILNVNFIREVDFYSGAFPAARGNALSSVMEFRQIDGNSEKTGFRATIGSSEIGLTADGPLGDRTNFIFSVRRSYLQFLFSAFKLPFLPTFTDVQFKIKHRFDNTHELTILGLGAYDEFELNKSANEQVTDEEQLELNNYILGNIPTNTQWNYTIGAVYKRYGKKSVTTLVASRNDLNNASVRYSDIDQPSEANQLLDYQSTETENKLRLEFSGEMAGYRFTAGGGTEYVRYTVGGFNNRTTPYGPVRIDFNSDLGFAKYGAFASVSKPVLKNRLLLSAGLRLDGTTYSSEMNNPLTQLSPRISASWSLTEKWSLNFNAGRYFQLPAYTIMGYSDQTGDLINKRNGLKYISADHLVGGVMFTPDKETKITLEGFHKWYGDYPVSTTDSISLANLGSDFGVVGNESVIPVSEGRAKGIELMIQRRSRSGIYGIMAYTFVRSEFNNFSNTYVASAWDNKHLLSLTAGKKLSKNWEAGIKWRYAGGRPYTPYDTAASALKTNWDVSGQGLPDYNKLNTLRVSAFHQLDIRIDKTWFLKKWSLNLYLDIQNVYNFKSQNPDILNVRTDSQGNPVTDPDDPTRYEVYFIKDSSGTILPTLGVILDF